MLPVREFGHDHHLAAFISGEKGSAPLNRPLYLIITTFAHFISLVFKKIFTILLPLRKVTPDTLQKRTRTFFSPVNIKYFATSLDNIGFIPYNKYRMYPILKGGKLVTKYEVLFYEKEDGTEPVKDFLLSCDPKMRAKMLRTIELLQNNGPDLRLPNSRHLDDGIFELRAQAGGDISRVLYFFVVDKRVILTNGFIKKTQKTPHSEIEKAKQYRRDFLSRKENRI